MNVLTLSGCGPCSKRPSSDRYALVVASSSLTGTSASGSRSSSGRYSRYFLIKSAGQSYEHLSAHRLDIRFPVYISTASRYSTTSSLFGALPDRNTRLKLHLCDPTLTSLTRPRLRQDLRGRRTRSRASAGQRSALRGRGRFLRRRITRCRAFCLSGRSGGGREGGFGLGPWWCSGAVGQR